MNPHDVVVQIAKIDPVLGLDRLVRIASQPVQDLALGREHLVKLDGRALDPEDRSQVLVRRVFDDGVLDGVDLFVELLIAASDWSIASSRNRTNRWSAPWRRRSRGSRSMLWRSWSRIGKGSV